MKIFLKCHVHGEGRVSIARPARVKGMRVIPPPPLYATGKESEKHNKETQLKLKRKSLLLSPELKGKYSHVLVYTWD